MNKVKISYIIITWNGKQLLTDLLISMKKQLLRTDVEVIVTDNGSSDDTTEWLTVTYPSIHLISLDTNKGVAYARNRALEQASGEYLFIIDNDIQLTDEAVEGMEQYMDTHPDVGMVGCRLNYPNGEIQESCKPYPGIRQKIHHILAPQSSFMTYASQILAGQPFEPEYIIGACQLIRAKAYKQVGPLDENIFYGPEDCDYCLRLRAAGWKVIYLPPYTMIHHCQRKTTTHPFSTLGRKHMSALAYFYWKHKRI